MMSSHAVNPKRFFWNKISWIAPLSDITDNRALLLATRWSFVLGAFVFTISTGKTSIFDVPASETTISNPWVIIPILLTYNLAFSFYIWKQSPLKQTLIAWFAAIDIFLALVIILLTGKSGSLYYLLSCIPVIEIALVFYWQKAMVLIIALNILFTGISMENPVNLNPYAPILIIVKFFVILMLGSLITLFIEHSRREEDARRQATQEAAQATALSEISLRLGKGGLNQERILATVVSSLSQLPGVMYGMVLVPDNSDGEARWRVAISNSDRHPSGELVRNFKLEENGQHLYLFGAGYVQPLPEFVASDGILQLIGIPLHSVLGNDHGFLLFGRSCDQPLNEYDQIFLHSLTLEIDTALRNAALYAQEQAQVAQLRRFDELRATFFSTIAHELKTPLTVLKTLVPSMSQLSQLPEETQTEISQIVEKNLTRLENLIEDLLESTRLEANAVDLHKRPTNLMHRVKHVLDSLSPLLKRKQREIILNTAPEIPPVFADGKRVEQIISNLINNANKFAPPETPIEVALQLHPQGVMISVADYGPGVPPAERQHIFEKYYIAVEDKALAGTGLGLFICRELVRLHNGQIWVEDRPGGGSRFCFTLPLALQDYTIENMD